MKAAFPFCQRELGQLTQADESPRNNGVVPVDIGKCAQVSLKIRSLFHCCCAYSADATSASAITVCWLQKLAGLQKHLSANKKLGYKESVLKLHLKPAGICIRFFFSCISWDYIVTA